MLNGMHGVSFKNGLDRLRQVISYVRNAIDMEPVVNVFHGDYDQGMRYFERARAFIAGLLHSVLPSTSMRREREAARNARMRLVGPNQCSVEGPPRPTARAAQ